MIIQDFSSNLNLLFHPSLFSICYLLSECITCEIKHLLYTPEEYHCFEASGAFIEPMPRGSC